jgi:CheY-like chemotaxis protein
VKQHFLLVVEDDAEIREALIELLNETGCNAVGTSNGAMALKYLAGANPLPCLILLDLMMPVMDGQAFREAQLQDPRIAHIPIVVVSAYRDVQSHAEKLHAATYLKKPPRLEDLLGAVAQYC